MLTAHSSILLFQMRDPWDFPSGLVDKTLCSQWRVPDLIPGQGTKSHMPQLSLCAAIAEPACSK